MYADADYANDKVDRKSITGWVTIVDGDVISWASKKQRTVSQSTCEAELYATAAVFNETLWLRAIIRELQLPLVTPSTAFGDNESSNSVAKNGIGNERTKHVDIKYHFITSVIRDMKVIDLKWIASKDQLADIFTKSLVQAAFIKNRDLLVFNELSY